MSIRANDSVPIPIFPSTTFESLRGVAGNFTVLPDENIVPPNLGERPLKVPHYHQKGDQWCWVACAQMVLRFFGVSRAQCEIATGQLQKQCCDGATAPVFCDEGCTAEEIDQTFALMGLAGVRINEPATPGEIEKELFGKNPRPIVAGIKWEQPGGHLIVITGLRTYQNIRYVRVNDPLYGPGDVRYSDLVEYYGRSDSGRWIHSWMEFRRA
jgi:hypothetical protein